MPESFTKNERLILLNQYRLLELIDEQGREAYRKAQEILEHGYVNEYFELTEGLSPEFPREQAEEVHDILSMHSDLRYNYERLEDKNGIAITSRRAIKEDRDDSAANNGHDVAVASGVARRRGGPAAPPRGAVRPGALAKERAGVDVAGNAGQGVAVEPSF